jgi:ketosteroid isomerase-like protein
VSQATLEAVRRVYEQWSEGDFRSSAEILDPRVVFILDPGFPDAGTYTGLEDVTRYTRGLLEPWSDFTIEAEEIFEVGDSVVAAVLQRGIGGGSGAAAELRYFQVWRFQGRKAIRLECFRDRAQALEAVGLGEPP